MPQVEHDLYIKCYNRAYYLLDNGYPINITAEKLAHILYEDEIKKSEKVSKNENK